MVQAQTRMLCKMATGTANKPTWTVTWPMAILLAIKFMNLGNLISVDGGPVLLERRHANIKTKTFYCYLFCK